jgi:hypothetical protein
MRDKLEDAFARLRHAFGADDYTPMEDVIEDVLQRFTGDLNLVSENSRLRTDNAALRAALADIARGDYSDPLCMRTPEQRAREALAPKKDKQ